MASQKKSKCEFQDCCVESRIMNSISIVLQVFRHFFIHSFNLTVDDGPNCVTFPSLCLPLSYTSLFLSPPLKGATNMSAVITSMFKNMYDARVNSWRRNLLTNRGYMYMYMYIWKQTTELATEFIDRASIADIEEFERIDLDAFSESKFERHGIHIRRLHLPFYVHSAEIETT